jgi:hypothetical protein
MVAHPHHLRGVLQVSYHWATNTICEYHLRNPQAKTVEF